MNDSRFVYIIGVITNSTFKATLTALVQGSVICARAVNQHNVALSFNSDIYISVLRINKKIQLF